MATPVGHTGPRSATTAATTQGCWRAAAKDFIAGVNHRCADGAKLSDNFWLLCYTALVRVLLTWLGAQDPWRPHEGRRTGRLGSFSIEKPDDFVDGPIFTFLKAAPTFDRLVLLFNPPFQENGAVAAFAEEMRRRYPQIELCPQLLEIPHPRDYEALYRGMRTTCEQARAALGNDAEYHILLSPGTPQMHATWVLLAKTVFPAQTWQSSAHDNESAAEHAHIPFDIDAELLEPARREGSLQPRRLEGSNIIAESQAMRRVLELAWKAAQGSATVLLLGESGVGKELVAQAIHRNSRRKSEHFIAFNCGALPESLVESELFGHVRGAFTGATLARDGLFRAAQGGTLFLDEIGDLPASLQMRLLRVVQEGKVRPVGTEHEIPVNVRLIAATHRDLEKGVASGDFRQDLYYRLNVFPIHIPPLRTRREDIIPLADHFMSRVNARRREDGLSPLRLLPSARRRLCAHPWPGNSRELENFIERLSLLANGEKIDLRLVEDELPPVQLEEAIGRIDVTPRPGRGLNEILCEVERKLLEDAWNRHGTQRAAAKELGLGSQQAFQKKCRLYGIEIPKLGEL